MRDLQNYGFAKNPQSNDQLVRSRAKLVSCIQIRVLKVNTNEVFLIEVILVLVKKN